MFTISKSLVDSWSYLFDCAEGQEEAAEAEFRKVLCRMDTGSTYTQMGHDFEAEVYKAAAGIPRRPHTHWEPGIQKVANIVRGAQFQVRTARMICVDGMDFQIRGVLDALMAGIIYDVKFKVKSFDRLELAGTYMESAQHPFYFYMVPEAYEFQYLVSDGEDLYKEVYRPEDREGEAAAIIRRFIRSLDSMGMMDLYRQYWTAKA